MSKSYINSYSEKLSYCQSICRLNATSKALKLMFSFNSFVTPPEFGNHLSVGNSDDFCRFLFALIARLLVNVESHSVYKSCSLGTHSVVTFLQSP